MMMYLGVFLIVYGVILLLGLLLQFPFFYNNMKSKALIKMMGKKGFNILLLVMGLLTLILGLFILDVL